MSKDELYHARSHKYIKREWSHGHWTYWYNPINPNSRTTYTTSDRNRAREELRDSRNANLAKAESAERRRKQLELASISNLKNGRGYNRYLDEKKLAKERTEAKANRDAALNAAESAERKRKQLELAGISALKRGEEPKVVNNSKSVNKKNTTVKSISTAVGSAFDKGKKWLSGILTTKVTGTPAKPIQPKTGGIFSTKKTIKV